MILTIKIIFLPQIGMARKEVHPDYHEVEIETFEKDGTKRVFKSMSTIKGDKVIAEVNIYKHPAWKEDTKVDTEGRSLVFGDVVVRVREDFAWAMHIDTDESNAAKCSGEVYGEIIK